MWKCHISLQPNMTHFHHMCYHFMGSCLGDNVTKILYRYILVCDYKPPLFLLDYDKIINMYDNLI